jgi:hemin transport system ATP-binding protein
MQNLQFRLQKTKELLETAKANHPDVFFPMDEVPIVLEDVAFSYDSANLDSCQFAHFSGSIKQGTAVCIAGGHGVGKSTLLKVVGDVLPQSHGTVFIPSHLRVLHLSADFILWPGTVAENIFFGECAMHNLPTDQYHTLDEHAYDGCLERGWKICKKLRFPSNLQREAEDLDSKTEVESLHLTPSQKQLIHLARAFIVNPEVLVIHQPTLLLGKDRSHEVAKALKSYVQDRGLVMDPETQYLRRPRTLIFTCYDTFTASFANDKFEMAFEENPYGVLKI